MTITAFSGMTAPSLVDLDATIQDLNLRNRGMQSDAYGNIGIGTAPGAWSGNCFGVESASGWSVTGHASGTASGTAYAYFDYNGAPVGSITQNGTTGVTYNTTSDHRLKLAQSPLTGSGAFIDALKPKVWTWATDGSHGAGFIAHEFAEVSPSSVTGTKDAVDENGAPVYQAMQASSAEVMANLVAEIQDLRRRLAAAGL